MELLKIKLPIFGCPAAI